MNQSELSPTNLQAFGPVPTPRQLAWHKREFYGFIHFSVNTFTGREWGYGDESAGIFAPTAFDADQIVRTAAEAGMKGLILTCKHHDGFCLWPSIYTEHSVKNSSWLRGKGDVVRSISEACGNHQIGFGIYLSPWDRNHPDYGGPKYIEYFRNQLHELTTQYGELFEVWFDGANGGDGYYGGANETRSIDRETYYDWDSTYEIVRRNQPNAVIFSDTGPDIRWIGNEDGIAGEPCWATIDKGRLLSERRKTSPKTSLNDNMVEAWDSPTAMLTSGHRHGCSWLPAECDVSIRPGWFYHASEDDKVRTPDELIDLYFQSVGRGASLLLNLPPDRRGLIHEKDVASLKIFQSRLEQIFSLNLAQEARCSASNIRGGSQIFAAENAIDGNPETYWSTDDDANAPAELILEFPKTVTFNILQLREFLPLGQRIDRFALDVEASGAWKQWCCEQAIGSRRLIRGQICTTSRVRFRVVSAPVCPAVSELALYCDLKTRSTPTEERK